MPDLVTLSEEDFSSQVLASTVPVLVEFSAPWCVPCRRMEPELIAFAEQWAGRLRLVRLDVDQAATTAARYGVLSVPTLILFINGQPRKRLTGYLPRQKIIEKIAPELE